MLWWEAIVSPEAQQHLGRHPASIAKLLDWTRFLVWWLVEIPLADYQTYRWLSDKEKEMIDSIGEWNMVKIQAILSNYI